MNWKHSWEASGDGEGQRGQDAADFDRMNPETPKESLFTWKLRPLTDMCN